MKKNRMMRIASVLLVAVLLSTCAISGTFAKYATSTSGTDTARVAYWGFNEPTTVSFNLFTHGDVKVSSPVGDVDLIAPGTTGSASLELGFVDHGSIDAPEVAYNYSVSLDISGDADTINALDDNPNFVWKLDAVEYTKFEDLKDAVDSTQDVAAGSLPTASQGYTIGWEWKFVDTAEPDTAMGNATDLDSITVTFTITATQLN